MGTYKQRSTPKAIVPPILRKKREIKPCPFCGGEAEVIESDHSGTFFCWCDSCETRGNYYDTGAEAIEAWNKRTVLTCTKETAGEGETHWYRCSNCKHAIDPGAYFCSLCGAKVVE